MGQRRGLSSCVPRPWRLAIGDFGMRMLFAWEDLSPSYLFVFFICFQVGIADHCPFVGCSISLREGFRRYVSALKPLYASRTIQVMSNQH